MRLRKKDEQEYIKRFKAGMSIEEAMKIYGKSERTILRYEKGLRKRGLINYRSNINFTEPAKVDFPLKIRGKETTKILKLDKINPQDIERIKKEFALKWKIPHSVIKLSKKKPFKTVLITADYHVPYQNNGVIDILMQLMKDVKFDGFYIVGDFVDLGIISHWLLDSRKSKTLEGKRLMEDYTLGNLILDKFDKLLPRGCDKRFWKGNHERFYDQFVEKFPQLSGLFNPVTELHLRERGYTVYEDENHIEIIGKLAITHGFYTGVNFLRRHLTEFKTNILHAHLHQERVRYDSSPAKELAIAGYSIGCACDMNPDYMHNRPHAWTHGFAVVHFFEDSSFDIDIKRIVKGRVVYNGKEYKGRV